MRLIAFALAISAAGVPVIQDRPERTEPGLATVCYDALMGLFLSPAGSGTTTTEQLDRNVASAGNPTFTNGAFSFTPRSGFFAPVVPRENGPIGSNPSTPARTDVVQTPHGLAILCAVNTSRFDETGPLSTAALAPRIIGDKLPLPPSKDFILGASADPTPFPDKPATPPKPMEFTIGLGGGTSVTVNADVVRAQPTQPKSQTTAILAYLENAVVNSRLEPRPPVDWRGLFARLQGADDGRFASARVGSPAVPTRRQAAAASVPVRPAIKVFVISLGQLGADAFRVIVVNESAVPITLRSSVVALEPLAQITERDVHRELDALSRFPQRTFTFAGYCLERQKEAPKAGMVYRVAPEPAQANTTVVSRLVRVAQHLRDERVLTPDTDPDAYYHSIVQWAIWTEQEKFDRRAFEAAFTEFTRKAVVGAGRRWTREFERAVQEIVPNRWRDVATIVNGTNRESPKE